MGRPSKQKAFVDKYFIKYYIGKTEKRKCIFCKESYAYNAFRLAKHLLICRKTDFKFQNDKVKIASLFKLNNFEQVSFSSNSSTETISSNNLGAIIPAFLKNDQTYEDSELMVENQDLIQNSNTIDSYEIIHQHIPASSTTTSSSNTNIFKNDSNATKLTTFSSKISRESNTRTLDGYVDRLINIQEQVITYIVYFNRINSR